MDDLMVLTTSYASLIADVIASDNMVYIFLVLLLALICMLVYMQVTSDVVTAKPSVPLPQWATNPLFTAQHQPRPSRPSCSSSPYSESNPADTIQVNSAAFHQLAQDRHRLHLAVKELTRSNASLRDRVWFLEDNSKALRADITQRARQYDELVKTNDALGDEMEAVIAERNTVAADRDDLTAELEILRAEKDVLQASKDSLVEDLEQLQAEMDTVVDGKEVLLGEKIVLEQRLAQEVVRVCQDKSERTRMEEEKGMLEAQLAAKQDTVDDLMAETDALEDDLCAARNSLQGAQRELTELRASTCPLSHLDAIRAELRAEADAHAQLRAKHEVQSGCLDLCRAALRLANEERAHLRGAVDRHRACQQVSDDLEDMLVGALQERSAEITLLKAKLDDLLLSKAPPGSSPSDSLAPSPQSGSRQTTDVPSAAVATAPAILLKAKQLGSKTRDVKVTMSSRRFNRSTSSPHKTASPRAVKPHLGFSGPSATSVAPLRLLSRKPNSNRTGSTIVGSVASSRRA
ncbi:hypothetical protein C8Q76DRAFT_701604 [Earliella scabrosa]|nr:hypothetical protein C8Q76DRAFT_701604 [Earliella scabrosa]